MISDKLRWLPAFLLLLLSALVGGHVFAMSSDPLCPKAEINKTLLERADSLPSAVVKPARRNVFKWIGNYLKNANKEKNKPFDFGLLLGPSYSATTSLGIGVAASGLYSLDRSDSTLQKSNVSLFGNASIAGMLSVGIRGNNFFRHDRFRINYQAYMFTFPSYIWGIGYKSGCEDANKSKYNRVKFQIRPDFQFKIFDNTYLGAVVDVSWVNAYRFERPEVIQGQDPHIQNYGVGVNLIYDSRDFVLNAYRGNYFRLEQMFYPSWMGNKYSFSYTDLTYSAYRQVWKGGVLAMELHGLLNYGSVPWTMLAQVGTMNRMRGYYEGRYRDRNILEGQVELRQRIKGRNGVVAWVGFANVFKNFDNIWFREILPNYGVGYRWEFKKRVNVRLDLGFTKDKPNVSFNINEAF